MTGTWRRRELGENHRERHADDYDSVRSGLQDRARVKSLRDAFLRINRFSEASLSLFMTTAFRCTIKRVGSLSRESGVKGQYRVFWARIVDLHNN